MRAGLARQRERWLRLLPTDLTLTDAVPAVDGFHSSSLGVWGGVTGHATHDVLKRVKRRLFVTKTTRSKAPLGSDARRRLLVSWQHVQNGIGECPQGHPAGTRRRHRNLQGAVHEGEQVVSVVACGLASLGSLQVRHDILERIRSSFWQFEFNCLHVASVTARRDTRRLGTS